MAKTMQVFDFEGDANGVRVIAKRATLHGGCMSDREIDVNIKLLKDDLDAVAKRMKAALKRDLGKAPL